MVANAAPRAANRNDRVRWVYDPRIYLSLFTRTRATNGGGSGPAAQLPHQGGV
ncbi:MAG TPA: hypothetical protein VH092_31295 [Urbifossiella sp.]|jgi:hypothetical protein|nr:hypothetical protein [Urbifossiella sp.]